MNARAGSYGLPNIKGGAGLLSFLLVPLASSVVSSFPSLEKLLSENQFLAAGLAFVFVTTMVDYVKLLFVKVKRWGYAWFCSAVTLEPKEEITSWCTEWFYSQGHASKANFFSLKTVAQTATSEVVTHNIRGEKKPNFLWAPAVGDAYYFKFEGKWVSFEWKKNNMERALGTFNAGIDEQLEIIVWGGTKELLQKLIDTVVEFRFQRHKTHTRVYTVNEYNKWALAAVKDRRNISTVVLDTDVKAQIMDDVENFIESKQFYTDCGIPYRRGYLLYGPPGTGKTSFIFSLAGKLQMGISFFSLSGREMSDANLLSLFQTLPPTTIVVLEDVDAIFLPQNKAKSVTFSGLLNALDGIASGEGRILFMTTNHYDRLSPTLIRPGRVDLKVKFDLASTYQIRAMVERFFPFTRPSYSAQSSSTTSPYALNLDVDNTAVGDPHPFALAIMNGIGENTVSTAQLQDWFIKNLKTKPDVMLAALPAFVKTSVAESKSYETSWDMMVSMHGNESTPSASSSQEGAAKRGVVNKTTERDAST